MVDFAQMIREEAAAIDDLHAAVDRTVGRRDRDARSLEEWEGACSALHSYVSRLDAYLRRAYADEKYSDPELVEFVVCFLEVDARFFRSGYIKQVLLTRLKRSELTEATSSRLRQVLVSAVERRGTREFKYYCRLAAVLTDPNLVSVLESLHASEDRATASRATLMLEHVRKGPGSAVTASNNALERERGR
jgi:hypothetical protein